MKCEKCNKGIIPPEKRCDCRLDWQVEKCYKLEAEVKELRDILKNLISCENFEQYIKEHNKAIEALNE